MILPADHYFSLLLDRMSDYLLLECPYLCGVATNQHNKILTIYQPLLSQLFVVKLPILCRYPNMMVDILFLNPEKNP